LRVANKEGFRVLDSVIRAGFVCAWGVLILMWLIGVISTKATARRASLASRLVLLGPIAAAYLLVNAHVIPRAWFVTRVWPHTTAIQLLGLAVTILGCVFAIWARLTLGSNWSGLPAVREGHQLIVRGPYKLVRHPIYTGLLLGLAGSAIASGISAWIGIWILVAISYTVKIQQEEQLMMQTFPNDYPAYRRRVKALIPGVL
jgi:protein-S-isoprenylcysteine O-methyltransferase Ste14